LLKVKSKPLPINNFQKNTELSKMAEFVAYLETDVDVKQKLKRAQKLNHSTLVQKLKLKKCIYLYV